MSSYVSTSGQPPGSRSHTHPHGSTSRHLTPPFSDQLCSDQSIAYVIAGLSLYIKAYPLYDIKVWGFIQMSQITQYYQVIPASGHRITVSQQSQQQLKQVSLTAVSLFNICKRVIKIMLSLHNKSVPITHLQYNRVSAI